MELSKKERAELERWQELRNRIRTSTAAVSNESGEDKTARIKRLIKPGNEEAFCNYYFPHYCKAQFGWFHIKAFKDINAANSFNVWEWAREHAKSVFANVFTPALKLARKELTGFILGSENENKAKVLIGDFEAELWDNQRFKNDFSENGDFHITGTWREGHYTIDGGIGFWSFGIGQNPAGVRKGENRPNVGVIDDADNKKKYKNSEILKQDLDWCLGEFLGCLSIKAKTFIFTNNRVSKTGLTAHIVGDVEEGDAKRKGINHIKVFATEDPKTHKMLLPEEPGATPAWKENYTLKHITKRMDEMGYRNSMRQFYHLHIEDGNIFMPEHLPWAELPDLHKYENLITYCDPSYKDTKKSDFKAIVLIGQIGRYFDVITCWVRQTSKSNMVKAHYDIHELVEEYFAATRIDNGANCKPVVCAHYMEANFVQDIILDEYYTEGDIRDYQLRIRKDERAKPDKFGRIEDLEPLAARGLLRFNAAKRKDNDMKTLRDQFLSFPNGHDDGPDAVEGGLFLLQRRNRTRKFDTRIGSRQPRYKSF